MDEKIRQRMYQLAEGFSMKAHKTNMVLHPVVSLIDFSVDHLKQVVEYVRKGQADLKRVEAELSVLGLPHPNPASSAEVRANLVAAKRAEHALEQVMTALREAGESAAGNIERLQGVKVPLKGMIDQLEADIHK